MLFVYRNVIYLPNSGVWHFAESTITHILGAAWMKSGPFFNNNHFGLSNSMPIYVSMWLILSAWYVFIFCLLFAIQSKCLHSHSNFSAVGVRELMCVGVAFVLTVVCLCVRSLQKYVIESINVIPCYIVIRRPMAFARATAHPTITAQTWKFRTICERNQNITRHIATFQTFCYFASFSFSALYFALSLTAFGACCCFTLVPFICLCKYFLFAFAQLFQLAAYTIY